MTATAREALREIEPVISGASRVRASMRLHFSRDSSTGDTFLAESHQEPPLRVVRAFTLADGAALAHLHNVSGGLLGGDRLALRVRLAAEARVQLTTTGATRIYHPRREALATAQATEISVGENALLEYVPDPIIPFAGARFRQQTTIQLASGAGLFWWEILAPGREARGELFAYDRMELRMDIWTPERLIAAERVRLEPRMHALSSLARLGDYRYWATFYICRVGAVPKLWATAEERLR